MLKKFLSTLLLTLTVTLCLTACDIIGGICHTHSFGEWEAVTAATCTEAGERVRRCECGEAESEAIAALGHDLTRHEGREATCTEDGWAAYETCSRCDRSTYEEIEDLWHNFVDGACARCGLKESEGLEFTSNGDGTCYVSGIGTCADADIVIPKKSPDGDSVTSIGEDAFYYCDSMMSVVIGDNITSIGDWAFFGCYSLSSVTIRESVASIGNSVFTGCENLTSITVDENNEHYASIDGNLYTKDLTVLIQYAIGKEDESFNIPDGVKSIYKYAFLRCDRLVNVVIPDSVTSIGGSAFYECTNLTSVVIPDSVTDIGEWAFASCDRLTIYCKAESEPDGWDSEWNYSNRLVIWGYMGE